MSVRDYVHYGCERKRRFATRRAAKNVAISLQNKFGSLRQCVYECPHCGGFHLSKTSVAGRGRLAPRAPKPKGLQ